MEFTIQYCYCYFFHLLFCPFWNCLFRCSMLKTNTILLSKVTINYYSVCIFSPRSSEHFYKVCLLDQSPIGHLLCPCFSPHKNTQDCYPSKGNECRDISHNG